MKRRTIKAPLAGQVTQVLATRGHSVVAGTPVIELVETQSLRVTAYMPEMQHRPLRVGQQMALKSRGRMAHLGSLTGVVSNVGSTIVQLPARLWRHPRIPEYGRAIHVLLDENRLLPGEVVSAEPRPGTRPTPPVPAPLANTAGQVEPPRE